MNPILISIFVIAPILALLTFENLKNYIKSSNQYDTQQQSRTWNRGRQRYGGKTKKRKQKK